MSCVISKAVDARDPRRNVSVTRFIGYSNLATPLRVDVSVEWCIRQSFDLSPAEAKALAETLICEAEACERETEIAREARAA